MATEQELKEIETLQRDYQLALESQRHFDDLIVKFRTAGFTVVGALMTVGAGAMALSGWIALGVWVTTWIVLKTFTEFDQNYYNRLLIGAVEKTKSIDEQFMKAPVKLGGHDCQLFGLSENITRSMREQAERVDRREHSSSVMIGRFYKTTSMVLSIMCVVALLHAVSQTLPHVSL